MLEAFWWTLYAENSLRFYKQDNIKKENPIGCQIQEKNSKERLVSNYRNLMLPFWNEISNSPLGCNWWSRSYGMVIYRETNKHQIIDNNSTFYINGVEIFGCLW